MWYWLFINKKNQYIIMSEEELKNNERWLLEDESFELINDSFTSRQDAKKYAERWYKATKIVLSIIPISYRVARDFINQHHRHHKSSQGQKFAIGLTDGINLIGVVTAGRPVSRYMDDGQTLEVTRCCVKEIYKNGISKLYSHVCKVAQAMGYKQVITYTLASEPGASMKAANFNLVRKSKGGSWNSDARERTDKHPTTEKYLWLRKVS